MGYIADKLSWSNETEIGKLLDGEIWLSRLDADSFASIANEHCSILITCYIDKKHLSSIAQANGQTESEILSNILPDKAHLRSGDFGEILSRSVLQEWKEGPQFPAERWRNRSTKNDTVRGTDLIGYCFTNNEPSEDDLIVLCEVKTRESGGDKEVVQKAYDGVLKDNATRLAHSLYLLQHALLRDGMEEEAKKLGRFAKPYENPYRKRLTACIVHEDKNWTNDYLQILPNNHNLPDEFIVVVILVENLAKCIDEIYDSAINSYELSK
jgi:hypothetical protein